MITVWKLPSPIWTASILEQLQSYISYLEERYGEGCYSSRILSQMELQFQSFIDEPYTIARRLSMFKTNIEALAEWILEFQQQALQIDWKTEFVVEDTLWIILPADQEVSL